MLTSPNIDSSATAHAVPRRTCLRAPVVRRPLLYCCRRRIHRRPCPRRRRRGRLRPALPSQSTKVVRRTSCVALASTWPPAISGTTAGAAAFLVVVSDVTRRLRTRVLMVLAIVAALAAAAKRRLLVQRRGNNSTGSLKTSEILGCIRLLQILRRAEKGRNGLWKPATQVIAAEQHGLGASASRVKLGPAWTGKSRAKLVGVAVGVD